MFEANAPPEGPEESRLTLIASNDLKENRVSSLDDNVDEMGMRSRWAEGLACPSGSS